MQIDFLRTWMSGFDQKSLGRIEIWGDKPSWKYYVPSQTYRHLHPWCFFAQVFLYERRTIFFGDSLRKPNRTSIISGEGDDWKNKLNIESANCWKDFHEITTQQSCGPFRTLITESAIRKSVTNDPGLRIFISPSYFSPYTFHGMCHFHTLIDREKPA